MATVSEPRKGELIVAHRITKLEFVPRRGVMFVNALGTTARGTRIRIRTVSYELEGKSRAELKRARTAAVNQLLGSPS